MSKKHPLKSSSIVLLVAIAAILLTFFVLKPKKEASDKDQESAQLLFPGLERDQVIEVSVKSQDLNLSLSKSAENSGEWFMDASSQKYKADKNSVDGMISSILAAKKESEVNNVDPATVGLSPAKFTLQMPFGNPPKPKVLLLGDDTPVDYLVYAKWSDENTVFTTSRSLRFAIDKKVDDLRNKKVLSDLKPNTISNIVINVTKKENLNASNIDLKFNSEQKVWEVTGKPEIKIDQGEVLKWVGDLAATSVKTFLSENEKERSLYGYNSPVATFKVVYNSGAEQKWQLSAYTPKEEPKEKKWALSGTHTSSTFEVAPTFVDHFKIDLFKFRDKKIAVFEPKNVQKISISSTEGTSIDIEKQKNDWKILANNNTALAKKEVVETVLRSLTELRADKFHENERNLGFQKPQRIVTLDLGPGSDPVVFFFGKSLAPDEVVVKSSQNPNPASVAIDTQKTLSLDLTTYIDERASGTKSNSVKGDAIKMEATVANLKDLKKLPEPITKAGYEYSAKMTLQDGKEFEILFDAEAAPYTVSNFLHLARNGFYNNVKFHRVIADFVAQGGDPTGTGAGGPGWKFHDESNNLTHQRGVLSMANAGPNTNGSQFFIVLQPQPHLNGRHTVFGKITKGLDLIDKIKVGDVMKTVEVFERAK